MPLDINDFKSHEDRENRIKQEANEKINETIINTVKPYRRDIEASVSEAGRFIAGVTGLEVVESFYDRGWSLRCNGEEILSVQVEPSIGTVRNLPSLGQIDLIVVPGFGSLTHGRGEHCERFKTEGGLNVNKLRKAVEIAALYRARVRDTRASMENEDYSKAYQAWRSSNPIWKTEPEILIAVAFGLFIYTAVIGFIMNSYLQSASMRLIESPYSIQEWLTLTFYTIGTALLIPLVLIFVFWMMTN